MTTIEQLRINASEARKAMALAIEERIEVATLTADINKSTSPIAIQRAIQDRETLTLNTIIGSFEAYDGLIVRNSFGFGPMVDKICTICTTILYANMENKLELLMATGLSEQLIEDLLTAKGRPAYPSSITMQVKPSLPCHIEEFKSLLDEVGSILGVTSVNYKKITEEFIEDLYASELSKATIKINNSIEEARKALEREEFSDEPYEDELEEEEEDATLPFDVFREPSANTQQQ